jgi:kynurenine formamidase
MSARHAGDFLAASRVYDLGRPLFRGMPMHPFHPPYLFSLMHRHDDEVHEVDAHHGANELIVLSGHSGTHIDGLGHVGCGGRLHGGADATTAARGGHGYRALGIDLTAPLACRGVLLDIARMRGVPSLSAAEAVTADDLTRAEAEAGVTVRAGDVVLIRTGWGHYWEDGERYVGVDTGLPGPDLGAAQWLSARGIRATGSDTIVYERFPPHSDVLQLPVHVHLLVDQGIFIMEALDLEALAGDRVTECGFVALPLKLVGATGSPIRPIAIV